VVKLTAARSRIAGGLYGSLLFFVLAAASPAQADSGSDAPARLGGFEVVLEDETREIPGRAGRIRWATYWNLAWDAHPQALAYQIETMTSEGVSPKLKTQDGTFIKLEVASGENKKSLGLDKRDLQIALISGQLSYRVRALLADNRAGEWSAHFPVGRIGAPPPWKGGG